MSAHQRLWCGWRVATELRCSPTSKVTYAQGCDDRMERVMAKPVCTPVEVSTVSMYHEDLPVCV